MPQTSDAGRTLDSGVRLVISQTLFHDLTHYVSINIQFPNNKSSYLQTVGLIRAFKNIVNLTFQIELFPRAAGDELEGLLLVVELGLGEVDGSGAGGEAGGGGHVVQLSLGEITGNEGQLGILVSLPPWGSWELLGVVSSLCGSTY